MFAVVPGRMVGEYVYIYIFYKENVLKLFSFILGINIFLDGFVPTENMRFRTESLVFKVAESATEEEVIHYIHIYVAYF